MPMDNPSMANSLGEGDTPLVLMEKTGDDLGLDSLWYNNIVQEKARNSHYFGISVSHFILL